MVWGLGKMPISFKNCFDFTLFGNSQKYSGFGFLYSFKFFLFSIFYKIKFFNFIFDNAVHFFIYWCLFLTSDVPVPKFLRVPGFRFQNGSGISGFRGSGSITVPGFRRSAVPVQKGFRDFRVRVRIPKLFNASKILLRFDKPSHKHCCLKKFKYFYFLAKK